MSVVRLSGEGRGLRMVGVVCAVVVLGLVGLASAVSSARAAYVPIGSFYDFGHPSENGVTVHQQRIAIERSTGRIFVVNAFANQVEVYTPAAAGGGTLVASFGAGELVDPFGVAVDQQTGAVYVSDGGGDRIVRYTVTPGDSPTYTLDGSFAGPALGSGTGEIGNFAAALAIDDSARTLLIADPGNNMVKRFTLAGAYDGLSFDGGDSAGDPADYPYDGAFTGLLDLAVDASGDIVVVDANGNIADSIGDSRVLRFSRSGVYESRIGASLARPATVAVRPFDEAVVVSWNQDNVNFNGGPKVDVFSDAGTPLDTMVFPSGYDSSVVTGLVLGDGPYGRLFVATDSSRSSAWTGFGNWALATWIPPSPTLVTGEGILDLTARSVKFTANLDTPFAEADYHFEYGIVGEGFTGRTAFAVAPTEYRTVAKPLRVTGLVPDTLYQVRVVADNGIGAPTVSAGLTFRTPISPPSVVVGAASKVTGDGVSVSAQVDSFGLAGSYSFSVSEVGGPEKVAVPLTALPAASGPRTVSARVDGLSAGKTYAITAYVQTSAGTSFADPVTFSTVPIPVYVPPPPAFLRSGSVYGCDAPRLDPFNPAVRPGQKITLTGVDLGVAGTVAVGSGPVEAAGYSATAIDLTVPESASGTVGVSVNCGQLSNTIALVVKPPSVPITARAVVKGASVMVTVKVPGAGALVATGSHLKRTTKTMAKAGTVTLKMSLSTAGKAALKKAKTKKLRTVVRVRFTPTGGTATSATASATFTRGGAR